MAAAASDSTIELIHLDLATRYEVLARETAEKPRQLHSVN
jgi:hypothetical protein